MDIESKSVHDFKKFGFKLNPIFIGVMAVIAQSAQAELLTNTPVQTNDSKIQQCEQHAKSPAEKLACKNSPHSPQLLADATPSKAVSPKLLIDADEAIRMAEVTDSSTSNAPNKVNTPNKSKDSKALNAKEGKDLPFELKTEKIQVRAKRFYEVGPLPGLGLTKEEIPGNVQSITAKEIKEAHSLSLSDLLNKKLQSVTVNDYQGNPFQMDIQYRGFTAGPQIGTPQGLSVFFDGIRVNEPFGDVVNWDMIPMNAIAGVDVFPGSNPIFGLNTLGGAFTLKTKDGFTHEGVDAEILTGSFGRKQLQIESGWNNGTVALFGAGNFFLEDGWRQNSPSKVNQFFGKGSYRGDKLDLSLSTLLVKNDLVGNGLLPSTMYAQDPSSVFTAPDTTKNKLIQFQLSGSYFVNDNFTITGQVYRRDSKRHQIGADVMTDYDDGDKARRIPSASEQFACQFNSTTTGPHPNLYGIPDYYLVSISGNLGDDLTTPYFTSTFVSNGVVTFDSLLNSTDPNVSAGVNAPLDPGVLAYLKQQIKESANYLAGALEKKKNPIINPEPTSYSNGEPVYSLDTFSGSGAYTVMPAGTIDPGLGVNNFFYTFDAATNTVTKNYLIFAGPSNQSNCQATQSSAVTPGNNAFTYLDPLTNQPALINGSGFSQEGKVYEVDPDTGKRYYYPTALITDNQINQLVNGASLQFNWNLDKHKFMVGAAVDQASAEYINEQRLGLLDANRNAYLAPDLIHPMFAAATIPLVNNNFSGTSTTKSLYSSETWSPSEAWHFNASARYNETKISNTIATRSGLFAYGISQFLSLPNNFIICPNGVCTQGYNYTLPNLESTVDPAETEKFTYRSFNPSMGFTWQANPDLNVFANVAKGNRVPSVIELGCALDKTPVQIGDPNNPVYQFKSVQENRQCYLPSTLSGDPYLKQIKSTSYDVGMRGMWGENLQWNVGAYQTDLKDDIYFITVENGLGFFDNVGKTRRRGLEAGLSGKQDRWGFSINYSITDATFQDAFKMRSGDNSSAFVDTLFGGDVIQVNKGNKMPGVPLQNLNATVSYDLTPQWNMGLTAVAHSSSYARGNENNQHQTGVSRTVDIIIPDPANPGSNLGTSTLTLPPTSNPGKLPGYATFNFQTSYKFNKEWTATMLVNNVFDKSYFSAGRLGRDPFSPTVPGYVGAIGPDGYNHNSDNWRSTNFIAPGAPRGAWFSLNWHFEPDKNVAADMPMPTEPSELERKKN